MTFHHDFINHYPIRDFNMSQKRKIVFRILACLLPAGVLLSPILWHISNTPPASTLSPASPPPGALQAGFNLHTSLSDDGILSIRGIFDPIALPSAEIKTGVINASATLYTSPEITGTGTISMASLDVGTVTLGEQTLTMTFTPDTLLLNGNCDLNPWLNTYLSTTGWITNHFDSPTGKIAFHLPLGSPDNPLSLTKITRKLRNAYVEGSIHTEFSFRNADFSEGIISTFFTNISIHAPESKLSMSNLNLYCSWILRDLPRSEADASLSIDQINWNKFTFNNLASQFQILKNKHIVIREINSEWCKGKLNIFALTISPESLPEQIKIYAEELQLDELLRQCGLETVTAEGHLDGRLPIKIRKSRLSIENGLLGSPPGAKGSIQIGASPTLDKALGATMSTELMLAREALRSFKYEWVRVLISTEKGSLSISTAIHGIPADPIPFTRDRSGKILSSKSPRDKWLQDPMTLVLNFHLPLPVVFE